LEKRKKFVKKQKFTKIYNFKIDFFIIPIMDNSNIAVLNNFIISVFRIMLSSVTNAKNVHFSHF